LEGTLGFIETRQRDSAHGEWFFGVNPDGSLGPRGDTKGEEWKEGYHTLRALVFLADWIKAAEPRAAGTENSRPSAKRQLGRFGPLAGLHSRVAASAATW
jgi:hypothetical protein